MRTKLVVIATLAALGLAALPGASFAATACLPPQTAPTSLNHTDTMDEQSDLSTANRDYQACLAKSGSIHTGSLAAPQTLVHAKTAAHVG
jgi:hypothetical protein